MKKLLVSLILIIFLACAGWTQESSSREEKREKYLTRAEVANMLLATEFLAKKANELLSWTVGYDASKINRAAQAPSIKFIQIVPSKAPADGQTIITLQAMVEDPGGRGNIASVTADLSSIGRLPNMIMLDNGLWGDAQANDGVYSLQTSVSAKTTEGAKEIVISVANKNGWVTVGRTTLTVENIPTE